MLLLSETPYSPSIGMTVPGKTHQHLCVPNSCHQNARWEMLIAVIWLGLCPWCCSPTTLQLHPGVGFTHTRALLPPEKCPHFTEILQNRWEVSVYAQGEEPTSHPPPLRSCNDNAPGVWWPQSSTASQVPPYIINMSSRGQAYWQNTEGWLLQEGLKVAKLKPINKFFYILSGILSL